MVKDSKLLCAALALLLVATRCCVPAVLLQPALTKARSLPQWARLVQQHEGFFAGCDAFSSARSPVVPSDSRREPCLRVFRASTAWVGSCHRTGCCLLFWGPPSLEPCLASTLGLEAVLLNDIMVSHAWSTNSSWPWRDRSLLNVLDGRAYLRALRLRAAGADDQRFVHGLNVVLGPVLKGRTSSYLLRPIVMKAAALQVAYGLYPRTAFLPNQAHRFRLPYQVARLPARARALVLSRWFLGCSKGASEPDC